MKLSKLTLKNFKGIKKFTLTADGKNVAIFGKNGTGKTTICDSLNWLLFDKDSSFKSQFEIKTLETTGEAIHGLDHEVEGSFLTDTREITLKKSYAEQWIKKRGEAQKTFTGHTTKYFVDSVPIKKKEYNERVGKIFNEETFKLLTTPSYFSETLPWKKRRDLLLEICGDISDEDVIKSSKDLKGLSEILGNNSLDDHKRIIAQKKAEINKQLEKIPVRIDEVYKGMPDIKGIEIIIERAEVSAIKKQIAEKEKEISRIESGGEVAEKAKALREIEGELLSLKNELTADHSKESDAKRKAISEIQERHFKASNDLQKIKSQIDDIRIEIGAKQRQIDKMRRDWHDISAEEFKFADTKICPTCGQDIPNEKIKETREKALAEFNLTRSKKLEKINVDGVALKRQFDEIKTELHAKEDVEFKSLIEAERAVFVELKNAKAELAELLQNPPNFKANPDYKKLEAKGIKITEKIGLLELGSADEISKIKSKIEVLKAALAESESKVARVEGCETSKKRIAELETEQKELAGVFENIESELFLMESFTRKKVEILEGKVNSRFKLARFKLFKQNINGGLEDCCEVLYNGTPFNSGTSRGERIVVGLDIISTLQKHYESYPFILIDDREGLTSDPETDCQLISFFAVKGEDVLRVEVDGNEVENAA